MLKSHVSGSTSGGASSGVGGILGEVEDFELVVADPAAFYANPAAIVEDAALSRPQRLRLLGEWAQDLVDRQVAYNEGMAPEVPGAAAAETLLMRQVNDAIEQVEDSAEAAPGLLARVWRRLTAI